MASDPVLSREPRDACEVPGIVGDERQPQGQRMSRHEGVECADRLAPPSQCRCDHGKSTGSGLIEGHNLDGLHERADQTVKLSRSACFSAVAELGKGDRADAELRGAVFQQTCRYPASATEGE